MAAVTNTNNPDADVNFHAFQAVCPTVKCKRYKTMGQTHTATGHIVCHGCGADHESQPGITITQREVLAAIREHFNANTH